MVDTGQYDIGQYDIGQYIIVGVMYYFTLALGLLVAFACVFFVGQARLRYLLNIQASQTGSESRNRPHSRAHHHGLFLSICACLPAFIFLCLWGVGQGFVGTYFLEDFLFDLFHDVKNMEPGEVHILLSQIKTAASHKMDFGLSSPLIEKGVGFYDRFVARAQLMSVIIIAGLFMMGFYWGWKRISLSFRARQRVESVVVGVMHVASFLAVLTTIGIILSLIVETVLFFKQIPVMDFLFGLKWSPQTAIREGQVGSSGAFGMVPLFTGTLLITLIAMAIAVPIGLFAAIYLSEYAKKELRNIIKPAIEILAGIPTVVYGFFAALIVAPLLRDSGAFFGVSISSQSALAAGLVMGVMIIPFISSLSDDVVNAVPQSLRDGAYALGSTRSETIKQVVLPAALPGIVSAILLGTSRAIGETMIVVMAAGVSANLTANPFEAVTTVTVQIVMLLVGDQEYGSAKVLSAFALGLMLFLITLLLNIMALYVSRKYKEQYE